MPQILSNNVKDNPQALATFIKEQNQITTVKAFESPQISALRKDYPEELTKAVSNLIWLTASQFNVARPMNELQIGILTGQIIIKYFYMSFEEIAYVFREAVTGRYGTVYQTIDGPTIFGWLQYYDIHQRTDLVDNFVTRAQAENPHAAPLTNDQLKELGYKFKTVENAPDELPDQKAI